MARSLPTTVTPIVKKKEVPILKKGTEGKLLVLDVKLKLSISFLNVSAPFSRNSSRIVRRTSEFSTGSMAGVNEEDELSFNPVESEFHSHFLLMLISFFSTRVVI